MRIRPRHACDRSPPAVAERAVPRPPAGATARTARSRRPASPAGRARRPRAPPAGRGSFESQRPGGRSRLRLLRILRELEEDGLQAHFLGAELAQVEVAPGKDF